MFIFTLLAIILLTTNMAHTRTPKTTQSPSGRIHMGFAHANFPNTIQQIQNKLRETRRL